MRSITLVACVLISLWTFIILWDARFKTSWWVYAAFAGGCAGTYALWS